MTGTRTWLIDHLLSQSHILVKLPGRCAVALAIEYISTASGRSVAGSRIPPSRLTPENGGPNRWEFYSGRAPIGMLTR